MQRETTQWAGRISAAVAAVLAGTMLAGTGAAHALNVIGGPIIGREGDDGWYTSPVTIPFEIKVDGYRTSDAEILQSYSCSGPAGPVSSDTPTVQPVTVRIPVAEDTRNADALCHATADYFEGGCSMGDCHWTKVGDSRGVAVGLSVKVDQSPPVVKVTRTPAPNADGWNNTPVRLEVTGQDGVSGVRSCRWLQPSVAGPHLDISNDQVSAVKAACVNGAGLSESAFAEVWVDQEPPKLAPSINPSGVLLRGAPATAAANATDDLSRVASSSCGPVDTSSVGTHTVICTATDHAGNRNSATLDYTVGYGFDGFAAPINGGGVRNLAKGGQTIPLKFHVSDADGPVTDLVTYELSSRGEACDTGDTTDAIEGYTSGRSGLQNLGNGDYQLNWKTDNTYAGCRQLDLRLGDGVAHSADFKFGK